MSRVPADMPPLDLPEGTVLRGKYRIEKVLGEGGMGKVLLATHLWLDQKVAIKVLTAAALAMPRVVERFAREARASAKLKSLYVCRILDVDEDEEGMPFMVMEYLEGKDLAQVIRARGALPVGEAVQYLVEACEGVAEAHGLGIVHRDIKPSNLFLARQGEGPPVLKLLDFGISKSDSPQELDLTATNMALGSPRYMAPEQLRGVKHVGYLADVWSLGVVLYQMVTGVQPFDGATATEVAARIAADVPVSPSKIKTAVPAGVERAILRCLEKRPEDRFASAQELADSLAPFAPEGLPPRSRARPPQQVPEDAPTLRTLPPSEGNVPVGLSSRHLITDASNAPAVTLPPSQTAAMGAVSAPGRRSAIVLGFVAAGLLGVVLGGWLVLREAKPTAIASEPLGAPPATTTASGVALPPPVITAATSVATTATTNGWSAVQDAGSITAPPPTSQRRPHPAGSSKGGLELELK